MNTFNHSEYLKKVEANFEAAILEIFNLFGQEKIELENKPEYSDGGDYTLTHIYKHTDGCLYYLQDEDQGPEGLDVNMGAGGLETTINVYEELSRMAGDKHPFKDRNLFIVEPAKILIQVSGGNTQSIICTDASAIILLADFDNIKEGDEFTGEYEWPWNHVNQSEYDRLLKECIEEAKEVLPKPDPNE